MPEINTQISVLAQSSQWPHIARSVILTPEIVKYVTATTLSSVLKDISKQLEREVQIEIDLANTPAIPDTPF